MLDTHAVARSLTAAEFTPAQADAITDAVRLAAERGDLVTSNQFTAGLSEVRTEIAALDTRLSTQVAEVRTEIAALDTRLSTQIAEVRTEIAGLDTRLSTQIADLRTEQRTANAGLEARLSAMETRLTWRIVGGVAAVGAILRLLA